MKIKKIIRKGIAGECVYEHDGKIAVYKFNSAKSESAKLLASIFRLTFTSTGVISFTFSNSLNAFVQLPKENEAIANRYIKYFFISSLN